jgi:tRNA(adenine34) deaminase
MPTIQSSIDTMFMKHAINEAKKTIKSNDVPIGAIIVHNFKIIARAHNQVEKLMDSTAHAELIAIKKAIKKVKYKHLNNCTLYVTLEPCTMCSGAIVLSRIDRIVFGALDPKTGACGSVYNIPQEKKLNHYCDISTSVLEYECSQLLKEFFTKLRKNKKNGK